MADEKFYSFRYGRWLEQTFFANKPAEYLMLLLVSAALIVVRSALGSFRRELLK
jgi:hypothetical protein